MGILRRVKFHSHDGQWRGCNAYSSPLVRQLSDYENGVLQVGLLVRIQDEWEPNPVFFL